LVVIPAIGSRSTGQKYQQQMFCILASQVSRNQPAVPPSSVKPQRVYLAALNYPVIHIK
jgi:hypothetical protein